MALRRMRHWIGHPALAVLAGSSTLSRDDGQTLVEYALILVLIAIVVIVVLVALGGQIKSVLYGNIIESL
jgi:Flp pilus assembly pilin Flp